MTTVSLKTLLGMIIDVRTPFVLAYANMDAVQRFKEGPQEIDWVAPLRKSGGALRYTFHLGDDTDPYEEGTGRARLDLLPRLPQTVDDLVLCSDIKPLASVGAGKYTEGGIGHMGRYAYVNPRLSSTERWIHHLPLMPLAMDLLNRFASELAKLPSDLNWREDLSHLQHAA